MERTLAATREAMRATKEEHGGERRGWRILTGVAGLDGGLGGGKGGEASNQRGARRRETRREDSYRRGGLGEGVGCGKGNKASNQRGEQGVDRERRCEVSYIVEGLEGALAAAREAR